MCVFPHNSNSYIQVFQLYSYSDILVSKVSSYSDISVFQLYSYSDIFVFQMYSYLIYWCFNVIWLLLFRYIGFSTSFLHIAGSHLEYVIVQSHVILYMLLESRFACFYGDFRV